VPPAFFAEQALRELGVEGRLPKDANLAAGDAAEAEDQAKEAARLLAAEDDADLALAQGSSLNRQHSISGSFG